VGSADLPIPVRSDVFRLLSPVFSRSLSTAMSFRISIRLPGTLSPLR
jgi:hypothetical protein